MEKSLVISAFTNGNNGPRPVEDVVHDCVAAGFRVLDYPMSNSGFLMETDYRDILTRAVNTAEKLGARFRTAHLPCMYPAEDTPERWAWFSEGLHRAIDAAREYGFEWAAIHTHSLPVPGYDEDAERRHAIEHIEPYVEHAARIGQGIAAEIMGNDVLLPDRRWCSTPRHLIELLDAFDTPYLGVCWDIGHANIARLDQAAAIRQLGTRIKLLHCADNCGLRDEHLPPFLGTVDWYGIIDALKEAGFQGDLNFEVKNFGIPFPARRAYVAYLAAIGDILCARFNA
ncbi:MAG: sugar phosphate isomerase/epimerase [Clostridiales bacterium]|jgi:L-ribulose-5-phosphate 3-epimerase|nr:sugar phosphate isomerase/epimerase [Clostridiales bacterium]